MSSRWPPFLQPQRKEHTYNEPGTRITHVADSLRLSQQSKNKP